MEYLNSDGRATAKRVRIEIVGRPPKACGIDMADIKAAATYFAARSRARIGNPLWHEVTVHLIGDAASDEIHHAVMGVAGVTDVVTQAYDAIPPETPGLYGELFVNTDQALRAAPKRRGWSSAREMLLYVAHGMDHLSGADDLTDCGYRAMRRRELEWIREWFRRAQFRSPHLQTEAGF